MDGTAPVRALLAILLVAAAIMGGCSEGTRHTPVTDPAPTATPTATPTDAPAQGGPAALELQVFPVNADADAQAEPLLAVHILDSEGRFLTVPGTLDAQLQVAARQPCANPQWITLEERQLNVTGASYRSKQVSLPFGDAHGFDGAQHRVLATFDPGRGPAVTGNHSFLFQDAEDTQDATDVPRADEGSFVVSSGLVDDPKTDLTLIGFAADYATPCAFNGYLEVEYAEERRTDPNVEPTYVTFRSDNVTVSTAGFRSDKAYFEVPVPSAFPAGNYRAQGTVHITGGRSFGVDSTFHLD